VGKASRRKSQRRQGIGPSRADLEARRNYQMLATGIQMLLSDHEVMTELEKRAMSAWTGGVSPPPVPLPQSRPDSAGDRFFAGEIIADAAAAPVLSDAALPSPQQMAENSGHWRIAVSALIRAVVLEGSPVDDPTVTQVLDLLAPAVHGELALEEEDDPDFPETHAPLFLLGACALNDATWSIVGLEPLDQALALMENRIGEALAQAGPAMLPDAKVIAEQLVRAFARRYECTNPDDVRTLERIGRSASSDPLVELVLATEVSPADALRLGLITLAALADLARTDTASTAIS
jgi:hypothetical protein